MTTISDRLERLEDAFVQLAPALDTIVETQQTIIGTQEAMMETQKTIIYSTARVENGQGQERGGPTGTAQDRQNHGALGD